jgi:hypothetical protein
MMQEYILIKLIDIARMSDDHGLWIVSKKTSRVLRAAHVLQCGASFSEDPYATFLEVGDKEEDVDTS